MTFRPGPVFGNFPFAAFKDHTIESAISDDMVTYTCEIDGIADLERIVALVAVIFSANSRSVYFESVVSPCAIELRKPRRIVYVKPIVALAAMSALCVRSTRKYVFAVSAEGLNYRVSWPAYCKTRNANLL